MIENKTAVIVDDDQKIVLMVEKTLKEMGFRVYTAGDGNKALELVTSEKPVLLITDILQPGVDGLALCKKIKNDPGLLNTKVILITGVFSGSSFKLQMDCEPDAFLDKPLDLEKLKKVVETTLNNPVG